jgi:hypothetical protein
MVDKSPRPLRAPIFESISDARERVPDQIGFATPEAWRYF